MNSKKNITVRISESIGKISCILTLPPNPVAIITLAHGAGAGMKHPFMESLALQLADRSITSLRFNFPYIEQGKRRPDVPAVAEKTVKQIIEYASSEYSGLPLYVSGKSFGGRMTSQLLSKDSSSIVKGMVFFGFPLHAPGKPSIDRAAHLNDVNIPMLFLQGTRDALADITLISKVVSKLSVATLVRLEGADHSFKKGKEYLINELADETARWVLATP